MNWPPTFYCSFCTGRYNANYKILDDFNIENTFQMLNYLSVIMVWIPFVLLICFGHQFNFTDICKAWSTTGTKICVLLTCRCGCTKSTNPFQKSSWQCSVYNIHRWIRRHWYEESHFWQVTIFMLYLPDTAVNIA